jgi:hypothetical protein
MIRTGSLKIISRNLADCNPFLSGGCPAEFWEEEKSEVE